MWRVYLILFWSNLRKIWTEICKIAKFNGRTLKSFKGGYFESTKCFPQKVSIFSTNKYWIQLRCNGMNSNEYILSYLRDFLKHFFTFRHITDMKGKRAILTNFYLQKKVLAEEDLVQILGGREGWIKIAPLV